MHYSLRCVLHTIWIIKIGKEIDKLCKITKKEITQLLSIVQYNGKDTENVTHNNKLRNKTYCVTYTEKYPNAIMTA